MFSQALKALLIAAPLSTLVVATNSPPAPISSREVKKGGGVSSSLVQPQNVDGNCDHCYNCLFMHSPTKFLAFNGNMIAPPNNPSNSEATNYVWPGLEPEAENFVLQPVLDGFPQDNGAWSLFQNWLVGAEYGSKQDASVPASPGQTLPFTQIISSDGKSWDISAAGATNNYAISEDLTQALFCGEFYKSNWQFGELVFTDVQLVSLGSDASFCTDQGLTTIGNTQGNFEGLSSSTDENGNVVCNISKLTMTASN